ncbi:MAG: magnesium-dependent phosphatase-1 [Verrucomicrobiae bacterium]|nr:magnesium-dependent phosphatase-1 [Verrucomicrobiae bacterium]
MKPDSDTAIPKLVVFDLDFTLWDCGGLWIDCTTPPFRLDGDGRIRDRRERVFRLYPEVPGILDRLESVGCLLGLASRTEQPSWAREVLDLMGIRQRFQFEEIYPGSKVRHFGAIQRASGLAYDEMVFFDDEDRNIVEVGALGVTAIHVRNGMNRRLLDRGCTRPPSRGTRGAG